jgi:hypothetical protein
MSGAKHLTDLLPPPVPFYPPSTNGHCCPRPQPLPFLPTTYVTYFATCAYLHEAGGIHPFVAGGVSGLAAWTACYPIDVARTRQVVSNAGFATALRQGGLWVGFGACAVRAVVGNATNFDVYEHVRARWVWAGWGGVRANVGDFLLREFSS